MTWGDVWFLLFATMLAVVVVLPLTDFALAKLGVKTA
jgi:hypothetical protein